MKHEESFEEGINGRKGNFVRFLPSTITIFAFCFGLTSIKFALFQRWEAAVLCIFISAVLDSFDGKVARLLGQSSQFGAQLDSLSDLVCFGVAPSIVLFLRSMRLFESMGWGVCMFFVVCCALRLARFNADQMQNNEKPDWEKNYFTGIPAPAGALLSLFPIVLFLETDNCVFLHPKFVFCCLLFSGLLMISSFKTFSSKMLEINDKSVSISLIVISFLVICLITELWLTLSTLIAIYLLVIPYSMYEYAKGKEESEQSSEK
ncbi:MAG: CDP-diacylglycerol--serine O-phosphatidyltransferase [Holosporaceae bacterium]|jgi:CDP-diacylglycerol--serine O-phosphatidyltransferase|nr:CDP-diacylglycerol--serine O-phosphatidyltransferase [Holosporaceae bacterium]